MEGLTVRGGIRMDKLAHCLIFKEYKRLPRSRYYERMIEKTPWGWLKGTITKTKRYSGFPSNLTLEEKLKILDKENELNKKALVAQELDNIEFC